MSALKIQKTLSEIERNMSEFAPYRKPALFNEFLVKGYTAVTLNSVPQGRFDEILQAKLCLGTLITLYDDFADRPSQSNPQLLEDLYKLGFGQSGSIRSVNPRDRQILDFAQSLFKEIENILCRQPNYQRLSEILNFDLAQFYSANRFSALLTANPFMNNPLENRLYAHHNMGMVMVAMIDLIATEKIECSEIGMMREVFLLGQRMGRIFNVLTTRKRELLDGDITGELATCSNEQELEIAAEKLRQEICDLQDRVRSFENRITTFSVSKYLDGLVKVQRLHEKMEGAI